MVKSKSKTKLVKSNELEALADQVDNLDASQFMTPDRLVSFDVRLKGTRNLLAVDPDLLREVRKQARLKRTSSEHLINLWVKQKLTKKMKGRAKAG